MRELIERLEAISENLSSLDWYEAQASDGGGWYVVVSEMKNGNKKVIIFTGKQHNKAVNQSMPASTHRRSKSISMKDAPPEARKAIEKKY